MNTGSRSGKSPANAMAARLREILLGIPWLRGWRVVHPVGGSQPAFDLLATGPLPGGGRVALCVVCKREMRPGAFRAMADKTFAPPGRPRVVVPVLALPWVSPRVAELCAERGWSWFDLAGNHRLDVPGHMLLNHTGNKPVHGRPRPAANLGTREAGRILRVLLAPEYAGKLWTQRGIRSQCQPAVSLGLVNKVVGHLRDEAFVEVAKDGGFRMRDPVNLLNAWRNTYRFQAHERRGYFTLLQGNKLHGALAGLKSRHGGGAAYAAFSAADFQAPHVRQPKIWLYVSPSLEEEFCSRVDAHPVDSGENLVVLFPDDEGVFQDEDSRSSGRARLPCTNPVQTCLDVFHCGGRGEEASEAVLNQCLKPAWKKRGLLA